MKTVNYNGVIREIPDIDYIGPEEIREISEISFQIPNIIPEIPYSYEELDKRKDDYILIWGANSFSDGSPVTIKRMKKIVGSDPNESEPCFYNQDWYDKESFVEEQLDEGWYLIRKSVFEDSRAIQPETLMNSHEFPTAIKCTYSFFVTWFCLDQKLWFHDFVWCKDVDHNGDRIYVGKYHDIDGVNKNGFSIHRHLALRTCYGCID